MTVSCTVDMPSATNTENSSDHLNGHHVPMSNYHNPGASPIIKEVWAFNLYEEFRNIRPLIANYPYLAMDTEFPGVVSRPIGEFRNSSDYQYQVLRVNVDTLKLIQLGVTFMNEHGEVPSGYCTWQFNFKFSLTDDMYAADSIELLTKSGLQFKKHETDGIDPMVFSELFITSGFVLSDRVKWLSFHSGYDFGYLLKLLTDQNLPKDEVGFFDLLKIYFPHIYDVKYLMKSCKNLKGGLQEVADQLEIERVGLQHQAGSDSLLTGMTYFRMKEMFFEDNIDEAKYSGHLYGFGTSFAQSNDLTVYYMQQQQQQNQQQQQQPAEHSSTVNTY